MRVTRTHPCCRFSGKRKMTGCLLLLLCGRGVIEAQSPEPQDPQTSSGSVSGSGQTSFKAQAGGLLREDLIDKRVYAATFLAAAFREGVFRRHDHELVEKAEDSAERFGINVANHFTENFYDNVLFPTLFRERRSSLAPPYPPPKGYKERINLALRRTLSKSNLAGNLASSATINLWDNRGWTGMAARMGTMTAVDLGLDLMRQLGPDLLRSRFSSSPQTQSSPQYRDGALGHNLWTATRKRLLGPKPYLKAAGWSVGRELWKQDQVSTADRFERASQRFGRSLLNGYSESIYDKAVFPWLFRESVERQPLGGGHSFRSRLVEAAVSKTFSKSNLAGNLAAAYTARLYRGLGGEPSTFRRFGWMTGTDALGNVLQEFKPEILSFVRRAFR
ncbi:MAG: hypothetical protein AB1898_15295 [Acidobacteriota bacterium]